MWRASDIAHVYASYGKGFETPTFNELAYRADGGAGLAFNLVPAKSKNGEIGVKMRPTQAIDSNVARVPRRHRQRAHDRDELRRPHDVPEHSEGAPAGRRGRPQRAARRRLATAARLHLARCDVPFAISSPVPARRARRRSLAPAGTKIPGVPKQDFFASLAMGPRHRLARSVKGEYVGSVPVNDLNTDSAPSYFVARRRRRLRIQHLIGSAAHVLQHRQCARSQVCRLGHRQRWQRTLFRAGAGAHVSCSECSGSGRWS